MTEQEEIQKCLNCPSPECVNCLDSNYHGKESLEMAAWIKGLCEGGRMLTDREIGSIVGIHANTVMEYRKRMGIPNLTQRRMAMKRQSA